MILFTPLLGGIPDARAEGWIYFYPLDGELILGVDSRWRQDNGNSIHELKYEERLRLNIGGYSLDPRFLNFSVRLEPALEQRTTESSNTETVSSDSTYLNYSARFDFLPGIAKSPFALSGDISASDVEVDGNLGNRREITTENRGAAVRWKSRAFPTSLGYRERSLYEIFYPGLGQPPRERDELQKTVTLQGRSSKMEVFLETSDFDDRTIEDRDYQTQEGRLNNTFRWGKGSYLRSRLGYKNRDGFSESERVTVDESVKLQHLENLYTLYRYSYELLSRTTDTETQRADFELNHELYRNLRTSLKLDGTSVTSDDFSEDTRGGNLDFNYTKKFMSDMRVTANLGGGYRVTERTGGQIDFTETPTVPLTGIVILAERFILWATILVTAPGCDPCLEGSDYIVEDAGGDYTQLRIPVGSRIAIGDVITVEYAANPPSVEYYGIPYRVGVRVDFGWVALYHRTSGEEQTFVSGPDPTAVSDRRTDRTGIEFRWKGPRHLATASAERSQTQSDILDQLTYDFRQSLSYTISPRASLTASLGQRFARDGTSVDAYTADASARWIPARGLSVEPFFSAFHRVQDPGGTDDFAKVGANVRWHWRQLDFDIRYDHSQRDSSGGESVEDRLMIKAKRKF